MDSVARCHRATRPLSMARWSLKRGRKWWPVLFEHQQQLSLSDRFGARPHSLWGGVVNLPGFDIRKEVVRSLGARSRVKSGDTWTTIPVFQLSLAEAEKLRKIAHRHGQCADRLARIFGANQKANSKVPEPTSSRRSGEVCATVRAFAKCRKKATFDEILSFADGRCIQAAIGPSPCSRHTERSQRVQTNHLGRSRSDGPAVYRA